MVETELGPRLTVRPEQFLVEGDALYRASPMPLRSRIHELRLGGCTAWIKRDDELSFGASGSKVRKYASLVPHLLARGATHGVVVGARNSNNVLAASQYLLEQQITPVLVLREQRDTMPATVFHLIRELVPDERILVINRCEWDTAAPAACRRIAADIRRTGGAPVVIPEGGSHPAALAGSTTLAIDIARNEVETGNRFSDVFIEAGSGLTALALALRCHAMDAERTIHVLCTAITPRRLERAYRHLLDDAGLPAALADRMRARQAPDTLAAGVRHETWTEVRAAARANGILFDPYYSGRLLAMVRAGVAAGLDPSTTLMVHTGGSIGLLPYLEAERAADRAGRAPCSL